MRLPRQHHRRRTAPSPARPRVALEGLECRRLLSTGDLDPTFGDGGKATINQTYYPDVKVTDAALQRDGKIIEVGRLSLEDLAVVRLNADGSIDPTFTPPTKVTDRRIAQLLAAADVDGASVVIQPDGQIVVGVEGGGNFYVLRFDDAGNLDHTFGKRGIAAIDFGATEKLTDIALAPDGKIVAVGYSTVEVTDPVNTTIHYYDNSVAVARLNPDGSADRSFSGSGLVLTPLLRGRVKGSDLIAAGKPASVAVQPDGKVVASATGPDFAADVPGYGDAGRSRTYVFRYNTDGTPDRSFGDGGTVWAQAADHGSVGGDLGIDSEGRITVAGFSFKSNPQNANSDTKEFTLLRFTARGRADRSFGDAGLVLGTADGLTGNKVAMVVHKNGTVVAAVSRIESVNETAAVYRFGPDGTPDTSFGAGGASPRFTGSPVAALPYRDGRTAIASEHDYANIPYNLLRAARVRADGSADPTFGPDGSGEVQAGLPIHANDVLEDMAVRRSDGKVVVHGSLDYSSLPVGGGTLKDLVVAYDDAGRAAIAFGPPAGFGDYGGPVALQSDDKVLVGDISEGGTNLHTGYFGTHRYNPDGTLDKPFGGGGSGAATDELYIAENGYFSDIVTAPDGRVVALARTHWGLSDDGDYTAPWVGELLWFSSAGAKIGGGAITDAETGAANEFDPVAMAFQSDGNLVVAGTRYHRPAVDATPTSTEIVVQRFGSAPKTFPLPLANGIARYSSVRAVAVGPDDKVTVIGTTGRRQSAKGRAIMIVRYNADGTPDTTFNGTGTLVTDLSGNPSTVVVQPDGKVVFAVNLTTGPVIARYTNAGALDARLDSDGLLDAGLGDRANIQQLAFDPDGKLVAGGTIGTGRRGRAIDLLLARYEW